MLPPIRDARFEHFKSELAQYPRNYGYYKVELVSIQELRQMGATQKDVLDALYLEWADHDAFRRKYPRAKFYNPVTDESLYDGYEYSLDDVIELLTYELKGGSGIGCIHDTIAPAKASELTLSFVGLFQNPRAYRGLAWADPQYVFELGAVLIDDERAGALFITEND